MNKNRLVFCIFMVLLAACRKDRKDEVPPEIRIFAPSGSANHQLPYTVNVDAEVSDETKLESVTVQIVDANMAPIGEGADVQVSSNGFRFNVPLTVDDPHLYSGVYYVKVKAGDGQNSTSRYAQLNLVEIPLQLKEVLIAETPSSSQTEIRHLNNNQLQSLLSISNSFSNMEVSGWHQQIAVAGKNADPLYVYDAGSLLPDHTIAGSGLFPSDYFSRIYYSSTAGKKLITSHHNGYVFGYDNNGTRVYSLFTYANYIVHETLETDDYMIAEIESPSSSRLLVVFYKTTGVVKFSQTVPGIIQRIYFDGNNTAILFSNDGTQARVLECDLTTGNITEPCSLPSGTINDVSPIDINNYLLAMNGYLVRYNHSSCGVIYLVNGISPADIEYEKTSGRVYTAEGYLLSEYDAAGNLLNSWSNTNSIKALRLLYNK
ncbi:MAG: hypothetical protein ACOZCO_09245 [Bacteroidota bacterium]